MAFRCTKRRNLYQKLSTEDENSDALSESKKRQSIDNDAFSFGSQELAAKAVEEKQTREQFLQGCHRRQAVCEKIEREMLDERGISLRKLRKYMILELILREVNLL